MKNISNKSRSLDLGKFIGQGSGYSGIKELSHLHINIKIEKIYGYKAPNQAGIMALPIPLQLLC
jgi:hypothetical protein